MWEAPACPVDLKKKIARTLIHEIVVDVDEAARELSLIVYWHGGCHIALTMPKPQSGAVAHKTALSGVSDTTLMRLIKANVLVAQQIAPYAPFEIQRADLDAEPVAGILERLKVTGKLVLDGDTSTHQQSLFEANQ